MQHLLLSTSSAVLRLCGSLILWRSVVQKHSPLTMFGLELPVFPSLSSLSRKRRGAPSALSGSERIDALRYQRIKKAKKMMMNNNNSKTRKKAGVNPVPVCFHSLNTDMFKNVLNHDEHRKNYIFLLKDLYFCFFLFVCFLLHTGDASFLYVVSNRVEKQLHFLSLCTSVHVSRISPKL